MARKPLRGCRYLLAGLILLLVLFPLLEEMARPILLVAVVGTVFVVGVIVVHSGRAQVRNAITLAILQIGLTAVAVALKPESPGYICAVTTAFATASVLIGYCIYCVLRYVLQASHITRDQIYAGICVYLMLGFAFGCIYYLTRILDPGCFAVNVSRMDKSRDPDLMYFSFVTLATLGYGDITPVARAARVLAELEALAGMLYMAIFMARLVSLASGDFSAGSAVGNGISDRDSAATDALVPEKAAVSDQSFSLPESIRSPARNSALPGPGT
jgi:hypothetical protein